MENSSRTCEDVDLLNDPEASFQAADYAILGIMLAMSGVIGIFFAWKDRKVSNLFKWVYDFNGFKKTP